MKVGNGSVEFDWWVMELAFHSLEEALEVWKVVGGILTKNEEGEYVIEIH